MPNGTVGSAVLWDRPYSSGKASRSTHRTCRCAAPTSGGRSDGCCRSDGHAGGHAADPSLEGRITGASWSSNRVRSGLLQA
ncbi:hypothetical protein L227DRAFT_574956 [Lentinus tigrinus ALCF2SS1-6]|uniref:Uncharacterized protein n=1 Tax=Lentinus tigrinus ALCF2SS1-6 TaxID=1328759 RepID=A0A5C2SCE2_9APHY|nr:hypothetical protein L227DRAFT_574956 [Lentinus tigrinus ALCF2SS1-6]